MTPRLWFIAITNYIWFTLIIMAIWNLGIQHWWHIQPIDFGQALALRFLLTAATTDSIPQPYFDKYGDPSKF